MPKTSFDEYPRATKDDEPTEIANWNILHVIGAGGMGLVFHGNLPDHTKAAIKIIKPDVLSSESIRRFEREIGGIDQASRRFGAFDFQSSDAKNVAPRSRSAQKIATNCGFDH
jgi:serine/threonine protein kinase